MQGRDSAQATRRSGWRDCSLLAVAGLGPCRRGRGRAGSRHRRTLLVVGDSLSAEYGLARGRAGWPCWSSRLEREKLPCARRQCQHQRRHHVGRALAAAGPAAAAQAGGGGDRTRRQRRAARPAAGQHARQPGGDDPCRQGRRRPCAAGGHAGAAQLRPQVHRGLRRLFAAWPRPKGGAGALPAGRRGRRPDAERCSRPTASTPGRGAPAHAGQRLAGAAPPATRHQLRDR
jgi:hypothetical protein